MKQRFFRLLSYLSVYTLGLYVATEKYYGPIETYRWVTTFICFYMFLTLANIKK